MSSILVRGWFASPNELFHLEQNFSAIKMGGKVTSGRTKPCANRAAQALRLAAAALRSSQSALGAYFRRLCSRMDKPKAVTAAAHKLARLIHTMLTQGEEYTDQGQAYYEERWRERALRQLTQRANKLGMRLVVDPQVT
jgi:transposase